MLLNLGVMRVHHSINTHFFYFFMTDVKQLIDDPSYLAYKFDFTTESIEFLSLADGDLSRSTWLTREELSGDASSISVPLLEVVKVINSRLGKVHKPPCFIFHTAYCASTFASRCLAVKGYSVSLREPQLLLDAANAKRFQWRSQTCNIDYRHLPSLALKLLQKHAEPNETLIIKPINSVNNIIAELLQASGSSKALMLYTDARNFMLSTLNKGEAAKQRQRAMFDLLRYDFTHLSKLGVSDAIHLSDLKISLTLWRLQLEQAEQGLARFAPSGAMMSMYGETLIKQPSEALQAVNQFLQLGISDETIKQVALGDLSMRDAKDSSSRFSISSRDANYRKVEDFHRTDLDNGYKWLTNNNPSTSLTPELSACLDF